MNLRISPDSIRLRITEEELRQLQLEGDLSAKTWFPGGVSLSYSVQITAQEALTLSGSAADIRVLVSQGLLERLRSGDSAELVSEFQVPEGSVKVVLEVDLFTRKKK